MVEFSHRISQAEVNSQYLNLTDDDGTQYGDKLGNDGKVLKVHDDRGDVFEMKRHHGNQLTRCTEWFKQNSVSAGTRVLFRFDSLRDVLYLLVNHTAKPSEQKGSLSFTDGAKNYEVKCSLHNQTVTVEGFVDGKATGGFTFPEPQTPRRG